MIKFIRHMRQKYKICNTEYTICKIKRTRSKKKLMTAYLILQRQKVKILVLPDWIFVIIYQVGFKPVLKLLNSG